MGIAHPNYKHGYYSKYSLTRPLIQAARMMERIREKAARRVAKESEQRRQKEALKRSRAEKNAPEWDGEMLARIFQEMNDQAAEAKVG